MNYESLWNDPKELSVTSLPWPDPWPLVIDLISFHLFFVTFNSLFSFDFWPYLLKKKHVKLASYLLLTLSLLLVIHHCHSLVFMYCSEDSLKIDPKKYTLVLFIKWDNKHLRNEYNRWCKYCMKMSNFIMPVLQYIRTWHIDMCFISYIEKIVLKCFSSYKIYYPNLNDWCEKRNKATV